MNCDLLRSCGRAGLSSASEDAPIPTLAHSIAAPFCFFTPKPLSFVCFVVADLHPYLQAIAKQFGPLVGAITVVILILVVVFAPLSSKRASKKRR